MNKQKLDAIDFCMRIAITSSMIGSLFLISIGHFSGIPVKEMVVTHILVNVLIGFAVYNRLKKVSNGFKEE